MTEKFSTIDNIIYDVNRRIDHVETCGGGPYNFIEVRYWLTHTVSSQIKDYIEQEIAAAVAQTLVGNAPIKEKERASNSLSRVAQRSGRR